LSRAVNITWSGEGGEEGARLPGQKRKQTKPQKEKKTRKSNGSDSAEGVKRSEEYELRPAKGNLVLVYWNTGGERTQEEKEKERSAEAIVQGFQAGEGRKGKTREGAGIITIR